ncbi:hypothetical protein SAY86_027966 [Trapa natans]|uniref:65-kDa microtubule-associated protein 3 n=1 Tax=Trapa natans TaxID=22666 RepID=A0AAN7MES6_TRANT|nr:hypothetical protein SAY86_027966 [Trapa natans]
MLSGPRGKLKPEDKEVKYQVSRGLSDNFLMLVKLEAFPPWTWRKLSSFHSLHRSFTTQKSSVISTNIAMTQLLRSGQVDSAREMFDGMPERSVVSWNTMISGCSKWRRYPEALNLVSRMHHSGMKLNESTFSTALSVCSYSNSLNGGKEIHSLILRCGSERFELVGSALLHFHATCSGIQEAEHVFEELIHINDLLWNLMIVAYVQCDWMGDAMDTFERMPRRDVAAWTSVISGFAKNGAGEAQKMALELFQLMRETDEVAPNEFTLDCVLRTCGRLRVFPAGLAVHTLVIKYGLDSDDSISGALIEFYSSCKSIDEARRVYDEAINPSVNASNSLLEGLISMGKIGEAVAIFNGLSELKPISYNLMIKGYAMNGQVEESKRLFEKMPQRTIASNTMISVYAKNGEIDKALQLFEEIKGEGNPVSWNSMISAYIHNCLYVDAFKLYRELCRVPITQTRSTFSALLQACSCLGSLNLGQSLHTHVLKTPFEFNVYVGTSLVDMYSRCGSIDDARKSFASISSPNVATWTALINGYAHHRLGQEAFDLFEEMLRNGVCPNSATFVGILSACGHSGLVKEGIGVFQSMANAGVIPTIEHYASVACLLARSGHLKEAEQFIEEMPVKADGVVWGALLSACWSWADMEAAERVAEKMFKLDSRNVSAYVILSNIYALSGRWRKKRKVRKQLRGLALKKDPGQSWIELNSGVHVFSVEDRNHPECDMIYWILYRIAANRLSQSPTPQILHLLLGRLKSSPNQRYSREGPISSGKSRLRVQSSSRVLQGIRLPQSGLISGISSDLLHSCASDKEQLFLSMSKVQTNPLVQVETTCGTLLYELQIIWNEIGESDADRDKMLLELEQECLEVYRRKVDLANRSRAQLRQAIADSEAELAAMCSAMGERPLHIKQPEQNPVSLKEELDSILPQLEEMRKRKCDRRKQFIEVFEQIQEIANEISMYTDMMCPTFVLDESDLSLRKLEELHRHLHALQKEKSDRLKQVQDLLDILHSLCLVLDLDFTQTATEVHASLADSGRPRDISNSTIEKLGAAIAKLREIKLQRMQMLQDLATTMLELWNLMDTPVEEQQIFQNVTCNIAASESEIIEPNTLSVDFINSVAAEVARLEELKSSKMKELVLKKRTELEEICRKTHLIADANTAIEYAVEAIESGGADPTCILEQIELEIAKVKEEALCRKELLEKIEKWLAACEEESWLEEYNRDDNRYNAGRGAHLTLKRAEKARALVNKLPAMVDALASKTLAWEKDSGIEFTYDGIRLLSMLEEYTILRQEKEEERRRLRDQKKLQGQLIAEQEALYGSKPSPSKTQMVKKAPRMSTGGASGRRLSLGGAMVQMPKPSVTKGIPQACAAGKIDRFHQNDQLNNHDISFAGLSAGRRGLDVAGLSAKKHSFDSAIVREPESPMMRKPFSPVTTTRVPRTNLTNVLEDSNNPKTNELLQKKSLPSSKDTFSTPLKTISVIDEENRTPRTMPIPIPSTPSTTSVPMQTAITPARVPVPAITAKHIIPEEVEYSFEERRAGFILPVTRV